MEGSTGTRPTPWRPRRRWWRPAPGSSTWAGESTRPGARPISAQQESDRVLGFIEQAAARLGIPLSVDTRHAETARRALEAGAVVVNDVSGLDHDPDMAGTVAGAGAGVVLMHMRGDPSDMRAHAQYRDVGAAVALELSLAVERARDAGIADDAIVLDPGFGFAKTAAHSLSLLADLGPIRRLGFPVLVGPSRKSFIGVVSGAPPRERLPGTIAACVVAYFEGARIFRVHDVEPVVQALAVAEAIAAERGVREEGADL